MAAAASRARARVYVALAAPWFVLVSRANPEFARFFFIHEHVERFLTETHNRTGEWWYFVPWLLLGLMPWLLVWLVSAAAQLARAPRWRPTASRGQRFCVCWAAFVFVFFSVSGSKLPSYILPMFPALALVLGFELTRMSARTLMWIALPLAVGAPLLFAGLPSAWTGSSRRSPTTITPASIYPMAFGPWRARGVAVCARAGIVPLFRSRNGRAAPGRSASRCFRSRRSWASSSRWSATTRSPTCAPPLPILADARRANGGAARAERLPCTR